MSDDELVRLRMENRALREMLEAAEDQIHSEWGVGPRQPYDWLPDLEQHICGQTGHGPTKAVERRYEYNNRNFLSVQTLCTLCDQMLKNDVTQLDTP